MLYEEDRFSPANKEEEFMNSRKAISDAKKLDGGYYKYVKDVPGFKKPVTIELYSSGETNNPIRNAITGEKYWKFLVGSKNENRFFKVRDSVNFPGKECVFFYETPDEYERTNYIQLGDEVKNSWKVRLETI